jgi:hypothetical protein
LVEKGKIKQEALAKERLNEEEIMSELRLMGIDDIKEVKQGTLETNGQIVGKRLGIVGTPRPHQIERRIEGKNRQSERRYGRAQRNPGSGDAHDYWHCLRCRTGHFSRHKRSQFHELSGSLPW